MLLIAINYNNMNVYRFMKWRLLKFVTTLVLKGNKQYYTDSLRFKMLSDYYGINTDIFKNNKLARLVYWPIAAAKILLK